MAASDAAYSCSRPTDFFSGVLWFKVHRPSLPNNAPTRTALPRQGAAPVASGDAPKAEGLPTVPCQAPVSTALSTPESVGVPSPTTTSKILDTPPDASVGLFDKDLSPTASAAFAEQAIGAPRNAHGTVPAPLPAADVDGDGTLEVAVYLGCFTFDKMGAEYIFEDLALTPRVRTINVS